MRVWPRSLTVRLLLLLFVAQIVTVPLSILAGALYVNGTWQNSDLGIGHDSAKDLLLAALRRAPDGSLRLASSPDLAAFQAARPGFEYAVVDPATGRAVPGSSSILAALFENLGAMRLDGGNFHLPGGEAPDALGFV